MSDTALRIGKFDVGFTANRHFVRGSVDGALCFTFAPIDHKGPLSAIDVELTRADEIRLMDILLFRLNMKVKEQIVLHRPSTRRLSDNPTSDYHGVHKHYKGKKCWRVQVMHRSKAYRASFYTEREAAEHYNELVIEHKMNRPLNVIVP